MSKIIESKLLNYEDNMKDIKADNKILPIKDELEKVYGEIDDNKTKLKNIDQLNNLLSLIKYKMEDHVNMINSSVKSKNVMYKMSSISDNNNSNYSKVLTSFDNDRTIIKKELESLYNKQEDLIKKQKQENDIKDNQDSKENNNEDNNN